MKTKRLCILFLALIIAVQCVAILNYRYKESGNPEREKNEKLWSTLAGQAEGRLVMSPTNPIVSQHFINQHEQLNEVILFFYHCEAAHSGQVYVRIKDLAGNIYYEYKFEPLYMQNDTFCLGAKPEPGTVFVVEQEYIIEVSVENMEEDDYVEVGTTLSSSKPSVFLEMADGNTLFTKLDYTYIDLRDVDKVIEKAVWLCLIADAVMILALLGLVWKRRKAAISLFIIGVTGFLVVVGIQHYLESQKWFRKNHYVVHAMGAIDNKAYLNALEAFEQSYQGGHRIFEVDFAMTSDRQIVLKHDWTSSHGLPEFENGTIPTLEEFKTAKIWGKYTTMDIEDLLQLMLKYPDIYVVTDSKSGIYKETMEQFTRIAEILNSYTHSERESIMDRLIVQLYNDDMYAGIENIIDYDNYIYTLYQRGLENLEQLGEFCVENEIPVVAIHEKWWTQEINDILHSYGLEVWVHTLNEKEEIEDLRDKGVDGIYTDVTELEELVVFE